MTHPDATPIIAEVAKKYQYPKQPEAVGNLQDLLSQIIQAIMDWLNSLRVTVPQTTDSRGISSSLQYMLYGLGIVALIVLFIVLFRKVKLRESALSKKKRGALDMEAVFTAGGWKAEAEKLAKSGEYRGACRALYLSLLQSLDENKIAIFAPAKTNYEYRYLLAKHPQICEGFINVADVVELIWFGNKTAQSSDYKTCLSLVSNLEKQAEAAKPPPEGV
jgi:hypothetical protein